MRKLFEVAELGGTLYINEIEKYLFTIYNVVLQESKYLKSKCYTCYHIHMKLRIKRR
jgi:hypothetical protein